MNHQITVTIKAHFKTESSSNLHLKYLKMYLNNWLKTVNKSGEEASYEITGETKWK